MARVFIITCFALFGLGKATIQAGRCPKRYLPASYKVPPTVCFEPFNWDDCGRPPVHVLYYYKPGSRCEVGIWRGCYPNQNMFKDEYECINTCIFAERARPDDYHQMLVGQEDGLPDFDAVNETDSLDAGDQTEPSVDLMTTVANDGDDAKATAEDAKASEGAEGGVNSEGGVNTEGGENAGGSENVKGGENTEGGEGALKESTTVKNDEENNLEITTETLKESEDHQLLADTGDEPDEPTGETAEPGEAHADPTGEAAEPTENPPAE